MAIKHIGYETANSYVKVKTATGTDTYLNTLKEIHSTHKENIIGGDLKAPAKDRYRVGGRNYFIGEPDGRGSTDRGENRYKNVLYLDASKIALAKQLQNGDEVVAVTALPSAHYDLPGVHDDLKQEMRKEHTVYKNGVPITYNVVKFDVILQPVATVLPGIFTINGEIHDRELLNAKKIIIDIGWGSTDVAIMNGIELEQNIPIKASMMDAYNYILNSLELANSHVSLFTIEAQLRQGDVFSYGGKKYDCEELKKEAMQVTASKILSEIGEKGVDLREYDFSIFGGGGTLALREHLKPHLEGVNAFKIDNPQIQNAVGCYIKSIVL